MKLIFITFRSEAFSCREYDEICLLIGVSVLDYCM